MPSRMQAKDISTAMFLEAMNETKHGTTWVTSSLWDIRDYLRAPEKVVRAKAKRLIRQGVIGGCDCGCRGDFEVLVVPDG